MGKQSKTKAHNASAEDNNLKRPDRSRTGGKPHKCQHCSYACRYNCELETHERVHTGEKPFKCRHCPFKTTYKSNLKEHEQWHRGERPYKCTFCPYAAVRRSFLEIHERVHTGEKPFKCRTCSYKSAYKSNLRIHEVIHRGDKPFKCQHCPYAATQSSNLKTHERTHSGVLPFKCQRCNYATTRSFHLKSHQKIHMRGNLSKLKHPTKLRSFFSPQKRLQSRRKSLKCKIPPKTATYLQESIEGEEESYCQDIQLGSSDDQEINKSSNQESFELFICKECNYALFSEKELCMHYSFCHKLPVVSLNTERTDCTIQQ